MPAGWKRSLSVDACALGNDTRYINSSRGCPLGPNLTDVEVHSPRQQVFLHVFRTCIMPSLGWHLSAQKNRCMHSRSVLFTGLSGRQHAAFCIQQPAASQWCCSADPSICSADPALTSVMTQSGTTFTSQSAMARQQGHALCISITVCISITDLNNLSAHDSSPTCHCPYGVMLHPLTCQIKALVEAFLVCLPICRCTIL